MNRLAEFLLQALQMPAVSIDAAFEDRDFRFQLPTALDELHDAIRGRVIRCRAITSEAGSDQRELLCSAAIPRVARAYGLDDGATLFSPL